MYKNVSSHYVWFISFPTGALSLPLCFRADKTFVVAVATFSHRAKLPGGVRRAAWANKYFMYESEVLT